MLTISVTAVAISTLAWYTTSVIDTVTIDSGIKADNYFGGGDGTSVSPYIISRPEHYFNLTQLQQSTKKYGTGNSAKTWWEADIYYQFGDNTLDGSGRYKFYKYNDDGVLQTGQYDTYLNMSYYSNLEGLIPIGSENYPFRGHIEGNNLTIQNIIIQSNGQADVGIFGNIFGTYSEGNYVGGTVEHAYFDNVTINIGAIDLTAQKATVKDSSNVTVHTKHQTQAYTGYIVGHITDADAALNNVYVNNCSVVNEKAGIRVPLRNDFGYIGCSEANPITVDEEHSSVNNVTLNAKSAHKYFSENYTTISNKTFSSTGAEYDGNTSKIVSDALDYTGTTATIRGDNDDLDSSGSEDFGLGSGNVSLGTAGYSLTNSITRKAAYQDDSGDMHDLSSSTIRLASAPADTSTLEDGTYVYYDSSKGASESNWRYLKVSSNGTEVVTMTLNCFYMTYALPVNNPTTTYYCKYSNGALIGTTTAPDSTNPDPDYFFCLRETAGSTGIREYSTSPGDHSFHIYSPNNNKYLNASTGGSANEFNFVATFSSGLEFLQGGNGTNLGTNPASGRWFYANGANVLLRTNVAGFDPVPVTFKGVKAPTPDTSYAAPYNKVTSTSNIADGDVITFVNYDGGTYVDRGYYVIGTQAKNNRNALHLCDRVNSEDTGSALTQIPAANTVEKSAFLVEEQTTGVYAFKDISTNQYLYMAGTSSSGSNYLRSYSSSNLDDRGKFQFTVSNITNGATIKCIKDGGKVPYIDFSTGNNNNGAYAIYRCFKSASGKPMIFKRSADSSGVTRQVYEAFSHTVETTTSALPSIKNWNIRYGTGEESVVTNTDSLLDEAVVTFNFTNSKVSFTPPSTHFQLVTSVDQVVSGETYAIATAKEGTAKFASTTTETNYRHLTSAFTVTGGSVDVNDTILKLELSGSTGSWYFTTTNYSGTNGKLQTAGSGTNNNLKITENGEPCSISINSDDAETNPSAAVITFTSTCTHNIVQFNSDRIACYTGNQDPVYLYKLINGSSGSAQKVRIGDQIGDGYDPNYIDVVGHSTITKTGEAGEEVYSFRIGATASGRAIDISSNPHEMNTKFYPTKYGNQSAVVILENNNSIDLGTVEIEYDESVTSTLSIMKGDGSLNPITSTSTSNTKKFYITTLNICDYCYCALDENKNIYAYFYKDGGTQKIKVYNGSAVVDDTFDNPTTFDFDNAKYFVLMFKPKETAGGDPDYVDIHRISSSFTKLPGNSGNFGLVGYRSAEYTTYSGGWVQSDPHHVTSQTILNFYFSTVVADVSYYHVKYNGDYTYDLTVYCNNKKNLYVFNYDASVYTVRVNGTAMSTGSMSTTVQTAYDPETGWAP